jgi:hypothetical protein
LSSDGGNKIVSIGGKVVLKRYLYGDCASHVRRLVSIYELLKNKQVPHVDHLHMYFIEDDSHGSCIYTTPVGLPKHRPRTESELREALFCVFKALSVSFTLSALSRHKTRQIYLGDASATTALPSGYSLA